MSDDERFTVRPFRAGDEPAILALFNDVFRVGNPDFVPRTLAQWNWAFARNPEGHHTFVAESAGRLVGTYTAIPARWRFPEGVHLGAQAVDTVVAPEFRRSLRKNGLFLTLAERWFDHYGRKERDRIVYGFPNPQAFRIGTTKVGYLPVHCPVPELALPLHAARGWEPEGIHVEEIERFGGEVDALDAALAAGRGISAVRDARYLNWRINRRVNAEDTALIRRVQQGMGSSLYRPGPLGASESPAPSSTIAYSCTFPVLSTLLNVFEVNVAPTAGPRQ